MLKNRHQYIVGVVGAILFIVLGATDVLACLCPAQEVGERIKIMKKEADAIFAGTVRSVEAIRANSYKVVISVESSWTEEGINEYTIFTSGASSGGCGVSFLKGRSYLVYAKKDKENRLVTEICWGTRELSLAKEDLKILGKPVATFSRSEIERASVIAQKRIIRDEYLKITPYVSTLEDVNRIYGEGDNVIKGREDFLSIDYEIDENTEVSIDYFRDCNQTDRPEKERTWVVEEVFFSFEHELKLKPEDIYLDKDDFTACLYGDVVGQIIFFRKEKDFEFTYLSLAKAVSNLSVMGTEENKQRYKCKKDKVIFSLDPEGFRCGEPV